MVKSSRMSSMEGSSRPRIGPARRFVALAILAAVAAAGSAEDFPRAWNDKPDLSGIWQALGTAHWSVVDQAGLPGPEEFGALFAMPPGQGIVQGGEIPYQDWAREQQAKNLASRFTEDPVAKCFLPGVPRATYMPHPFQILQGTGKIMLVYGFAEANRTIHLDIEDPVPAPIDSWMGRSHGHWEGDTLVVEAAGFNGQAWFDNSGNFASDTLRVTERYTPVSENVLRYEATIEDPNVFTRPWDMSLLLYRRLEDNARVLEYKCVEFSEELLYGHLRRKESSSE